MKASGTSILASMTYMYVIRSERVKGNMNKRSKSLAGLEVAGEALTVLFCTLRIVTKSSRMNGSALGGFLWWLHSLHRQHEHLKAQNM